MVHTEGQARGQKESGAMGGRGQQHPVCAPGSETQCLGGSLRRRQDYTEGLGLPTRI